MKPRKGVKRPGLITEARRLRTIAWTLLEAAPRQSRLPNATREQYLSALFDRWRKLGYR